MLVRGVCEIVGRSLAHDGGMLPLHPGNPDRMAHMPSAAPDVFVSYNHADRAWAEWIAWVLEAAGWSVVIQAWDFRPGGNFILDMHAATRAQHTLAVLSPSYLAAEYTPPEWAAALAADPKGSERKLLPIRVRECQPEGLLAQVTYADLVGLGEDEAQHTLLAVFAQRAKPDRPPAFPGKTAAKGLPPAFPGTRVMTSKLPLTGDHFIGRDGELARLDAAWDDSKTHVVSFVALGGAGKSALVNQWLDRLRAAGWRGAERVFGWSFYSQGTDAAGASGDAFTEYALEWFGYRGGVIQSGWKKGEVLAELVRAQRTALVLDGLEPLQHPPGAQTGKIKDPAVQALVRELAVQNPGLVVITTRLAVTDVAGKGAVVEVDLEQLPPEVGAELLRQLGVKGPPAELVRTVTEYGGHGLALTLLGTYLRDVCAGDLRRRKEVPLLDEDLAGGVHARRVMASYASWLGEGPELRVLRLLGLFDRTAEAAAVEALRQAPAISGLTDELGDEARWKKSLARLRQARLVLGGAGDALDAHPLVREYFGERLREEAPEAWQAGHQRLYAHYQQAAPEFPETLEAILPLYTAVVHGCRAGRVQEAADEVYWRRILRRNEAFSSRKLGAFGPELSALAAFFDRPWDQPSAQLTAADQAWILNEAGFVLRALGRLPEAVQPLRAGLQAVIVEENWSRAAICAGNLSELLLTLGEVASAVAAGVESVELADKSGDAGQRMVRRTTLADALHQAGQGEASAASFREAEAMQAEWQPQYPRLYSLRGYLYCDLLLGSVRRHGSESEGWVFEGFVGWAPAHLHPPDSALGGHSPNGLGGQPPNGCGGLAPTLQGKRYHEMCEEVRERASQALEWAHQNRASLLDIALNHLTLGRAHLGLALTSPHPDFTLAAEHLDRAVDGLRQSGRDDCVPWGLLARAVLHRVRQQPAAAAADLAAAEEIAERGHMLLHLADVHLERARLHLTSGDVDAARASLEPARQLVTRTGYGRRVPEVAWLEDELGSR